MHKIQKHLRNVFLAGIFAVVPVAITLFVVWYVDNMTLAISRALFKREFHGVGILIAVVAIYLSGLLVTSLLGKACLRLVDKTLVRIPLLRELYTAWKQISLTPGGTEGTFSRAVLLPDDTGQVRMIGFTSGLPVPGDPSLYCVYIPGAPNPLQGRLVFARIETMVFVPLSSEEVFKFIISTGNYVPDSIGDITRVAIDPPGIKPTDPASVP